MSIKRYTLYVDADDAANTMEAENGEYVRFTDYAVLEAELAACNIEKVGLERGILAMGAANDALRARIAQLEAGYAEAIEDIADWGAYADSYFQEKWDLHGGIAKHNDILNATRSGEGEI